MDFHISIDISTALGGIQQPTSKQNDNQLVGKKAWHDWGRVGNDCMAHRPHSNLSMMLHSEGDLDVSHPFVIQ